MKPIQFIGPSYKGRSDNYSSARTVNLYLEQGKGKAPGLLIGSPGLTTPLLTLTGGGIRCLYKFNDTNMIAVSGGNVYKVDQLFASTLLGTIANDDRPVQIVDNGTDIAITSGGLLYYANLTGTGPTYIRSTVGMVDYIDDHFFATENNTNFFIWSDSLTHTFDALNIQAANGSTGTLVGVRIARRTIYLFTTKSVETWYDAGTSADIPFVRVEGGFYEVGCVAKNSIAEMDTVFWLGADANGGGIVWTMQGGYPHRISTPAIEYAIAQWSDMSDAEAFTYSKEGHSFYVLSSASGNETWVYDITTTEWHQRGWTHSSGDLWRIRPRCHCFFSNRNLVGDWENGKIYEYDNDTYSDNGDPLVAIRACEIIQDGLDAQGTCSFRLDLDAGYGLTTGQGSDPQAMLRWSKDGGKRWSNALWRTMGVMGDYSRRCIWHRVGGGDRMVFEVSVSDPVKRNITGAFIE